VLVTAEGKLYVCKLCDEAFDKSYSLANHVKSFCPKRVKKGEISATSNNTNTEHVDNNNTNNANNASNNSDNNKNNNNSIDANTTVTIDNNNTQDSSKGQVFGIMKEVQKVVEVKR
jgi:hypothetical protein